MSLQEEKVQILEKIHCLDNVIKGSVFEMSRYCGKASCSCARNKIPHRSMFLSFRYRGKTRMIPIKAEQIPEIRNRVKDYKELKSAIDELARINAELLRPKHEGP